MTKRELIETILTMQEHIVKANKMESIVSIRSHLNDASLCAWVAIEAWKQSNNEDSET